MRIDHRWLSDIEIERSKEMTRQAKDRPRRHHHVPQMYLRRWAAVDGSSRLVRMTDLATRESDARNPDSLANEPWFYRITADDVDPVEVPDLWFEIHMSRVENDAKHVLDSLDRLPDGQIRDRNLMTDLAVFVGLQSQRTVRSRQGELDIDAGIRRFGVRNVVGEPEMLPRLCLFTGRHYSPDRRDELADEIAEELGDRPLISDADTGAKPRAIESAIGVWRNTVVPHLLVQRSWWLYSTAPLATCDEPVIYIGGRKGRASATSYTFGDAPLVLFPLDPGRLLVLADFTYRPTGPFVLDDADTAAINYEIGAACQQFVYEQDGSGIAAGLHVPPRPVFDPISATTFWESVHPPTRWLPGEGPEWPLSRWSVEAYLAADRR
ncbi:DUF4238 domain-containing protein [Rhodococcus sp. 14C212]|uniref:DUF4238 domain-containing protein n=1 Tax=Rhodococcus sp. 14C212 TaxID=2711209 RepID=UPI0013EB72F8|nr:DUF4238 domain-containing protein [Rhodococcus sp. 14C212]NGP09342.1 DUF4238 domain-containing protein [Rhodococcus sp. 14C212]